MAKDLKPLIKREAGRSRIMAERREIAVEDRGDCGVKITDIRHYKGSSYPYVSGIIIPKKLAKILLDELGYVLDGGASETIENTD